MQFNVNVTLPFLVLEISKNHHKGDYTGHCPIELFHLTNGEGGQVSCLLGFDYLFIISREDLLIVQGGFHLLGITLYNQEKSILFFPKGQYTQGVLLLAT